MNPVTNPNITKHPISKPYTSLQPLLLIQFRTLHYPADRELRFYSYYLESTSPETPLLEVINHATNSLEGQEWRLVQWSGEEGQPVIPLTNWNLCKYSHSQVR